jgi:hypothetical protein
VRAGLTPTRELDRVGTVGWDDLEPGDLLFANRRYWLQWLCDRARDPWVHVGVVAEDTTGERRIFEFGPHGYGSRPLAQIAGRYQWVGVGRVDLCRSCRDAVTRAARTAPAHPGFGWLQAMSAGLLSLAAYRLPGWTRQASRIFPMAAAVLDRVAGGRLICASFVLETLDQACEDCRPDVKPLHGVLGATSNKVTHYLATPSDIWRSNDIDRRLVAQDGTSGGDVQPARNWLAA